MTRINTIDPRFLSDAHLGAEYRELPRIFGLVRKAIERGESATDQRNPNRYTLGTGHVRFFYPRLGYLRDRFAQIVSECRERGRAVTYPSLPADGISAEWFGDWQPDSSAMAENISRIEMRGGLRR